MKEIAWLIYGLDVAVLKKNMRPASKVPNALRKASERTSLRECCGVPSRLPSALYLPFYKCSIAIFHFYKPLIIALILFEA